jgi:hypothetical protein
MRTLRRLWWVTLLGVVAPATLLALVEDPQTWMGLATMDSLVVGCVFVSGAVDSWQRWGAPSVASVMLVGALPVLGWQVLPLVLLMLATSRWVWCAAGARIRYVHGVHDRAPQGPKTYVDACLRSMSGRQLCAAWRASFPGVKQADVRARRLGVGLRANLLDELERRDAVRFRAWLRRSPGPASAPLWVLSLPRPGDQGGAASG